MRFAAWFVFSIFIATLVSGCSRTRYRTAADRDSYRILDEKANCIQAPLGAFTVQPDPRSRFYDASNPDCPALPVPRPVLHGYALPPLASQSPPPPPSTLPPEEKMADPTTAMGDQRQGAPVSAPFILTPAPVPENRIESNPSVVPTEPMVMQASYRNEPILTLSEDNTTNPTQTDPKKESTSSDSETNEGQDGQARKVSIPTQAWEVLPKNCLDRMLEFETLRSEYVQSYEEATFDKPSSQPQRLSLANLMELAIINSREYQARKELLFRTALALTRQRYQFDLNPTPFGNGTAADYRHTRTAGVTQDRLSVPSGVGVQRTLASGGEFLARFANSVVLTFNGPSGFAADVGSEMIFDFQQTVFQRDVRFENLTQAERDVIYATRDYLRFRKQLFRDVANQYYNLLVNYRGIEINAHDYFTNLRGFIQTQAEYRTAEKFPRIQVDQFEQTVLRSRSNLVNNCFSLDAAVDQLKFRIGLPTEMPIFIDLSELESISMKDELSVARQMISRARAELLIAKNASTIDATTLANVAEVLADRMKSILQIQKKMETTGAPAGPTSAESIAFSGQAIDKANRELSQLQYQLQILGARMQVDLQRQELDKQLKSETSAPPLRVLIRAIEVCNSELQVIKLALSEKQEDNKKVSESRQKLEQRKAESVKKLEALVAFIEKISTELTSEKAIEAQDDFNQIPERMKQSIRLAEEMDGIAKEATKDILPGSETSIESKVQSTVDETIQLSDRLLDKGPDGWTEIEIDPNEALLTSLVQRLDLMNQRGDLADAWRQIKLAGDDLKSIVDLRATQTLRTKSNVNKPLDFTFDDSETRLGIALDTPLNRRLQRNNFRLALISYNQGLRNLMAAEDSIKLDVREDLRQLALDRNQYSIAVASAALAYERVISTRMRLQFAVQNVAARDFLESQQAYTNALSAIARQHVNYITDRIELFFDLEAFDVDGCGYWSGEREDFGPQTNVDFPGTNRRPYDSLPPKVWYSPTIRQMEAIPPGEARIESN